MTIFVGAVWKFSLVLWSYILEPAKFFIKFSFLKTKTNIYEKIVNKMKKKELATEMLM